MKRNALFFLILLGTGLHSQVLQQMHLLQSLAENKLLSIEATKYGCIYAGLEGNSMVKSCNSGQNWTAVLPEPGAKVYVIRSYGDSIYAGGDGKVYFSANDGAAWTTMSLGLLIGEHVLALEKTPQHIYAGIKGKAVMRKPVSGGSWGFFTGGGLPINATVNDLLYTGGQMFAATDAGIYRLADGTGPSWQLLQGCSGNINRLFVHKGAILAATDNGICRSTDNGSNWTDWDQGIPGGTVIYDLASAGPLMIAGAGYNAASGAFLSVDDGKTWEPYNKSGAACCPFYAVTGYEPYLFTAQTFAIGRLDVRYTAVEEVSPHGLSVYPNPAEASCTIKNPLGSRIPYRLISADGRCVLTGVLSSGENTVGLEGLDAGIYLLCAEGLKPARIVRCEGASAE